MVTYLKEEHISDTLMRLTAEYAQNRVLASNRNGEVFADDPDLTSRYNRRAYDKWRLIPVIPGETSEGFFLVNGDTHDMVCHPNINSGELVSRPFSTQSNFDGCVWRLNKGKIYQKHPEGGERYLWLARDRLYCTNDSYLADRFIPISAREDFTLPQQPPPKKCNMGKWFLLILIIILVLFLIY